MVVSSICRFEIWLVSLNPTQGKEINKTRPCVIISPNEMSALSTVLVAPMTSKGVDFPCRVECDFKGTKGLILLDQIRVADKTRLIKKLGTLDPETQSKLLDKLQEMLVF